MKDSCYKGDFGCLERILRGKLYIEQVYAFFERTINRSAYGCLVVARIVRTYQSYGDVVCTWVLLQPKDLFLHGSPCRSHRSWTKNHPDRMRSVKIAPCFFIIMTGVWIKRISFLGFSFEQVSLLHSTIYPHFYFFRAASLLLIFDNRMCLWP